MMMAMLEAGGIPLVVDHIRTADDDNPKGYYEFERVKKVKEDKGWLDDAKGKAVKAISQLLLELPDTHSYRILFMRRKMEEILASQAKMLERRGQTDRGISDDEMGAMLAAHVKQVLGYLDRKPNMQWMEVNYNAMLASPREHIAQVHAFLGGDLDVEAMSRVVDKSLYRQRK